MQPQQDLLLDLPAVGPGPSKSCSVKASVLAVEAGRSVMLDRELLISKAEEAGIAVIGLVREEKPSTGTCQRRSFEPKICLLIPKLSKSIDQEIPKLNPRGIWPNCAGVIGVGHPGRHHADCGVARLDVGRRR